MRRFSCETAVSPVIGVMLMLSVTIIIAAVVSAYAGGASTRFEAVPDVSLSVYCDGSGDEFQILFEHLSGEPFQSEELKIVTWVDGGGTVKKHEQSADSERYAGCSPEMRVPYVYDDQADLSQGLEFGEAVWRAGIIAGTGNKEATAEFLGVSEAELDDFIESGAAVEVTIVHVPSGNTILRKEFILG